MIPVVSIVGSSNSGKTTLIERIIPELKAKGYKVGAIKHDAHNFDIDHQGKDTWRMTSSGADTVAISSSDKMAMIKMLDTEKSINELIDWLFKDVDIVITEGYKAQDTPKIEVVRHNSPIISPFDNLVALVNNTADDFALSLPSDYENIIRFDMSNLQGIVSFIEKSFLKKSFSN